MKIVRNSITEETDVAMELCTKVQAEEYVIHVVGSTSFYTHLRFSLLASTWFPLGVCLWSALHMLLLLYETLMLLILFSIVFVIAILMDAVMVVVMIYFDIVRHFVDIVEFLAISIGAALVWLWLVITCQCCNMRGRAPGEGLAQYLFTAGGTLPPRAQDGRPAGVMEGEPCPFVKAGCRNSLTRRFVTYVILVSFPYQRAQLGDLCREIVPWYDTIVI